MEGRAMHFDILVEDISGKKMLEILIPKIINNTATFTVHSYKGIGRLPPNMKSKSDASKRILLDQLPRLLQGHGRTYSSYPPDYLAAVIVVCDLDNKCLSEFRKELYEILNKCNPKPEACFCIAVEECEAWYLGDINAVIHTFKTANQQKLNSYINDSICGTWEWLADAVYPGGARALSGLGWQVVGAEKSRWASEITPHMNIQSNKSPSFCYFRDKIIDYIL
jgi:hypothetical protein